MLFDLEPYLPLNLFLILYMLTVAALALWVSRRTR